MATGRVDVDVLLAELSSRQFAEWMAFWELEPFGDEWRQAGTVAAAAVTPYLTKGKKVAPDDFLPVRSEPEVRRQTPEEMLAFFQGLATS